MLFHPHQDIYSKGALKGHASSYDKESKVSRTIASLGCVGPCCPLVKYKMAFGNKVVLGQHFQYNYHSIDYGLKCKKRLLTSG